MWTVEQPLHRIIFYAWLVLAALLVIKQLGGGLLIGYIWQLVIPLPIVLAALTADFGRVDVKLLIEVCKTGDWFELAPITFIAMFIGCAISLQITAKKMPLTHTFLCHLGMLIGMWMFSSMSVYLSINHGGLLLLLHLLAMALAAQIIYILLSIKTIKEKKIGNPTL